MRSDRAHRAVMPDTVRAEPGAPWVTRTDPYSVAQSRNGVSPVSDVRRCDRSAARRTVVVRETPGPPFPVSRRRAVGRSRIGGPTFLVLIVIVHEAAELGKRWYEWPLLVNVREPLTAWRRPERSH